MAPDYPSRSRDASLFTIQDLTPLFPQEIDRPFDHWSVLARIQWGEKRESEWVFDFKGVPQREVKFADLGLAADREYLGRSGAFEDAR